jgi:hypothetical protein
MTGLFLCPIEKAGNYEVFIIDAPVTLNRGHAA